MPGSEGWAGSSPPRARAQARVRQATIPVLVGLLAIAFPGAVDAQVERLEQRCAAAGGAGASCALGADIVEIAAARSIAIAAGGNPVPGTASTFGRRVSAPRVAFTARVTTGGLDLPDRESAGRSDEGSALGLNLDLAIGLTDGWSPAPTVGGVASVDLLAGIGTLRLPSAFDDGSPLTWAVGLRAGVLRESFTAPGISISVLHRRIGSMQIGSPGLGASLAAATLDGVSAWSATAALGKRIALFGVTAGAAHTWFSTDATVRARSGTQVIDSGETSWEDRRFTVFGSASWTVTVWSLVGEIGWQNSGDALTAGGRTPASDARGGGLFLTLGARLTF